MDKESVKNIIALIESAYSVAGEVFGSEYIQTERFLKFLQALVGLKGEQYLLEIYDAYNKTSIYGFSISNTMPLILILNYCGTRQI